MDNYEKITCILCPPRKNKKRWRNVALVRHLFKDHPRHDLTKFIKSVLEEIGRGTDESDESADAIVVHLKQRRLKISVE